MEEQLKEALSTLMAAAASASEFVAAQVPEVVHQAMVWYATKSLALWLLGVAALIAVIALDRKVYKLFKSHYEELNSNLASTGFNYHPVEMWHEEAFVVGYLLIGSLIRICLYVPVVALLSNVEWLMIWLAPKLWLMEKAAELIK